MTKSLLGGGAIAIALFSASLIFNAQTSVAEPLAQNLQTQRQSDASAVAKVSSGEISPATDTPANAETVSPSAGKSKMLISAAEMKAASLSEPETSVTTTGPTLPYVATAYCLRGRMANGRPVAKGFIAADRRVLPIGTRVRLEAGAYSGEYVVADTGGAVRGRRIDIWVPNTGEAMRFGRRAVKLTVLTHVRPRTATRTR